MQRLEVSGAVRSLFRSLGVKGLRMTEALSPLHKYAFVAYKGTQLYMNQLHFAFLQVQTPGTDNAITYVVTREW